LGDGKRYKISYRRVQMSVEAKMIKQNELHPENSSQFF